jgi:hypothetical protein
MTHALARKRCATEKVSTYQLVSLRTMNQRTITARQDAPAAANLAGLAGLRAAP